MFRPKADAGRGIASHRLEQDVFLRYARQLLLHEFFIGPVGSDIHIFNIHQTGNALYRELNHGFAIACKRKRNCFGSAVLLLGQKRSAFAAGHDECRYIHAL